MGVENQADIYRQQVHRIPTEQTHPVDGALVLTQMIESAVDADPAAHVGEGGNHEAGAVGSNGEHCADLETSDERCWFDPLLVKESSYQFKIKSVTRDRRRVDWC